MGTMMPYLGRQRPIAEEFNSSISKIFLSEYTNFRKSDRLIIRLSVLLLSELFLRLLAKWCLLKM